MKPSMLLLSSGTMMVAAGPLDFWKRSPNPNYVVVWNTVTVPVTNVVTKTYSHRHSSSTSTSASSSLLSSSSSSSSPSVHVVTVTVSPSPATSKSTSTSASVQEQAPVANTPSSVQQASVSTNTPSSVQQASASTKEAVAQPSPSDFASTATYHHNIHRGNHSASGLTWADKYAGYAEQTAKSCVFKHDLSPGNGGYGQNLAMWASSGDAESLGANAAMARAATDMWYNGELNLWPAQDYGKANPDMTNFERWGHFSQLVWANSKQVGCHSQYCPPGTMYSDMGAWYTVCNYYPAGNMGGAYGINVKPPLQEATVNA